MMFKNVVTTLYEKHYDYGVGVLVNSLIDSNFQGIICVGYKGSLPFWLNQLQKVENDIYRLTSDIFIRFDLLENIGMHLGYYKPYYLKKMYDFYSLANAWFYFDPDIIITSKWSFYEEWVKSGVCLCQDSNYTLVHWNHPWRNRWRNDFSFLLVDVDKSLNFYINSGFIGVDKSNFSIIDFWIKVNDLYIDLGHPIDFFDKENGQGPYKGDQDVLNATMTLRSDLSYSIIGKEGMAFDFPLTFMAHAIDASGQKPWNKKYIKNALKGIKPSISDELFLMHSFSPINIYSKKQFLFRKLLIKIAKLINRLWKK